MHIAAPDTSTLFTPELDFETFANHLWAYQHRTNPVIRKYTDLLGDTTRQFIPIRFFKDFEMRCGEDWTPEATFRSSGTTGQVPSKHLVRHLTLYNQSHLNGFHHFYPKQPYTILALLPNYLERGDSSLVHMVRTWMEQFGLPGSGFYLHNFQALHHSLTEATYRKEPILLIGVSFALLDFVENHPIHLPPDTIVMETGGMKGRREEMGRKELHRHLQEGFGLQHIHSEYGMTELLSQAYSQANGRFHCPPWMKVIITDPANPTHILPKGESGRINIIDLANIHSCAFIATDDHGIQHPDNSFEVLGRLEGAELRGCNLMYLS
jgi:hypothetical protein